MKIHNICAPWCHVCVHILQQLWDVGKRWWRANAVCSLCIWQRSQVQFMAIALGPCSRTFFGKRCPCLPMRAFSFLKLPLKSSPIPCSEHVGVHAFWGWVQSHTGVNTLLVIFHSHFSKPYWVSFQSHTGVNTLLSNFWTIPGYSSFPAVLKLSGPAPPQTP